MTTTRAMTLVEVLAALALLVVLSGGVLGFFFGVTHRRDELARLSTQQRDAAAVLDRLEAALMTAVALAPDGSAGIRGDAESISVATRAVGAALDGPASVADAAILSIAFDEGAARCDCTLAPLSGSGETLTEPLLEHVERMRFRYLKGRDWSESFDSVGAGGFPSAVEVSIWLERRGGPDAPEQPPAEPPAPGDEDGAPEEPENDGGMMEPFDRSPPDEEAPWTPREPDHMRVIVIPDAPGAGWQGGSP